MTGELPLGDAPPLGDAMTHDQPVRWIAPPAFLAQPAFAALLAALPDARVVGGAVRDAVADRPISDIDLATALLPAEVISALRNAGIRALPTGLAHGTVTAVLDDPDGRRGVEITTLRRDVGTDGRHATVAFTDDWRQDAARRDFTINAMSMTPDGAVHDYFDGLGDLRAGVVRFVGDPAQRIAEDTLRVLRYFRFFARYAAAQPGPTQPDPTQPSSTQPDPTQPSPTSPGSTPPYPVPPYPAPPDPAVRAALRAGISGLATLSAERVWGEVKRILAAPDPRAAVALMAELGILAAVIPEGADLGGLARLIATGAPADPLLRLAALLTGDVEDFADRLRLSAAERQRLQELRVTPSARPDDDDAVLRRLLAAHERAALVGRTWLAQAGLAQAGLAQAGLAQAGLSQVGRFPMPPFGAGPTVAGAASNRLELTGPAQKKHAYTAGDRVSFAGIAEPDWTDLRDRLARMPRPVFPLAGTDVLALGVTPGPLVGALLRAARAWWLAGGCTADIEDCRAELTRLISQIDSPEAKALENSPPSEQTGQ